MTDNRYEKAYNNAIDAKKADQERQERAAEERRFKIDASIERSKQLIESIVRPELNSLEDAMRKSGIYVDVKIDSSVDSRGYGIGFQLVSSDNASKRGSVYYISVTGNDLAIYTKESFDPFRDRGPKHLNSELDIDPVTDLNTDLVARVIHMAIKEYVN